MLFNKMSVTVIQWQRRFVCPKRRFRAVFVSFPNHIVLCRFKRRLKEKTVFKRRFPFSQSQGINKNAVYRFKRSRLSFILLSNQQPFQVKCFKQLTV